MRTSAVVKLVKVVAKMAVRRKSGARMRGAAVLAALGLIAGGSACTDADKPDTGDGETGVATGGGTVVATASAGGSATGTATMAASTTAGELLPDDAKCSTDEQCMSMACFPAGAFGGYCGECLGDDDCPSGGCTVPNPIAGEGAECNTGAYGEGCETSDVCTDDLVCTQMLTVLGFGVVSTCSECEQDGDCVDGMLCTYEYDIANFAGGRRCVAPGSLPDGSGCDFAGSGDQACENLCVEQNVMGVVTLGLCNACATDEDCAEGEVCNPPEVGTTGVTSGGCAPADA